MSVLIGMAALFSVLMTAFSLRLAWRGSRILVRLRGRRSKDIIEVEDGPVEIEGTIHAVGEALVAPSGRRCVAAHVVIASRENESHKSREIDKREVTHSTKAVVRDATGEIAVDLEHVTVSAPLHFGSGERKELQAIWTDGMRENWFSVTEACIEDGAKVVVSGRARTIRSDAAASGDAGYRGAAPAIVATRQIEGTEGDRVVISDGSRGTLFRRAALPAVVLFAVAFAWLAYAVGAVLVLSW